MSWPYQPQLIQRDAFLDEDAFEREFDAVQGQRPYRHRPCHPSPDLNGVREGSYVRIYNGRATLR